MPFKNELLILLTAAAPIAELRGAIPLGLYLKEPLKNVLLLAIIGNLIPIPFIYFFLEPVSKKLRKLPVMDRYFSWLFSRALKKSDLIQRYEALGLAVFVSIPLPMTRAWTGCIIASLFRMPFRYTFWAICAGVLLAAAIVTGLCLGGIIATNGLR
ncbi:MAG: small multi-drug export protein [Candidatus Omnitrophota bacterium]